MIVVYEAIRVKNGRLPLLDRHVARLQSGCAAVGIATPKRLAEVLTASGRAEPEDCALRVEWDGDELRISTRDLLSVSPVALVTSSVTHPGYTVKTTVRTAFEQAQDEAHRQGADEGLLLTRSGFVAEGTLFAIGWFEGPVLRVPSLDLDILPSIGRARILEIATAAGWSVEEGRYERSVLAGRPAFITTSVRGVVDVARLDGEPVPGDSRVAVLRESFWPQ